MRVLLLEVVVGLGLGFGEGWSLWCSGSGCVGTSREGRSGMGTKGERKRKKAVHKLYIFDIYCG
jgi:hypothetical protein